MFLVQQDESLVHLIKEATHRKEKEDVSKINPLLLSYGKAVIFDEVFQIFFKLVRDQVISKEVITDCCLIATSSVFASCRRNLESLVAMGSVTRLAVEVPLKVWPDN